MIANYGLSGEWRMECVSPTESRLFICFSTEFLDERVDLLTLVSTKWLNRIQTGRFDNRFAAVNTPDQNTPKAEETKDLKAQIDILQAEKQKLEAELKSREEMMSNLLSFIQASK